MALQWILILPEYPLYRRIITQQTIEINMAKHNVMPYYMSAYEVRGRRLQGSLPARKKVHTNLPYELEDMSNAGPHGTTHRTREAPHQHEQALPRPARPGAFALQTGSVFLPRPVFCA
jgi:hypothetical protein